MTTAGINAQFGAGGSISGTVTDASGNPAAGAEVYVFDGTFDALYNYGVPYAYAATDSNGNYSIADIHAGSYKVYFVPPGAGSYLPEWYNDRFSFADADTVVVTAGQNTSNINAQFDEPGTIAGTVTDGAGTPVEDVLVVAWDSSGVDVAFAQTAADGTYELTGLGTASYTVLFLDGYNNTNDPAHEWYNDQGDYQSADPVSVTAGMTTAGINAQFGAGGSISGTVTDASGNPAAGAEVYVFDCTLDALYNYGVPYAYAATDSNGNYSIADIHAGCYKVWFVSSTGLQEWYNDMPDYASASIVTVTSGQNTPNIDAQFGTISNSTTTTATPATTTATPATTTATPATTTVTPATTTVTPATTTVTPATTTVTPATTTATPATTTVTPATTTVTPATTTTPGGSTTTTTVNAGPNPCPSEKVLGSDAQALDRLRSFRDSTLAQSALGRKMINLYYANADSINAALDRSPVLRTAAGRVLKAIAPLLGGKDK